MPDASDRRPPPGPGGDLGGQEGDDAGDRAGGDRRLRVATFNIRNGVALDPASLWWRRRDRTLALLRSLGADAVGLQEVYPFQQSWLAGRLGVDAVGEGRGGFLGGERCPVLVRPPRRVVSHETRRYAAGPPRIATLCELDTGVLLVNTHLAAGSADARLLAATELAGWLPGDRPVVVLGDLNAEPGDPVLAALSRLRRARVDEPTAHAFRGEGGRRLDHVLVSRHWEVVAARVVRTPGPPWPSDHWPVVADLQLR